MPVKSEAEILAELARNAKAMETVRKAAEDEAAALRETEPDVIRTVQSPPTDSERFRR
jgi:hypothetical protein